jgi:CTP synthase
VSNFAGTQDGKSLTFHPSVQAHPEFTSKVMQPSPPFVGFVAASADILQSTIKEIVAQAGANGVNGAGHF